MGWHAWIAGFATLAALPGLGADEPGSRYLERLSADRGCPMCHAEKAPAGTRAVAPAAPSWEDIARRYRSSPGAEERLVALVQTGSDPNDRHWKAHAEFDRMPSNDVTTTPREARMLVRWILAF